MEFRSAPPSRSGTELLHQYRNINIRFGKHNSNTSWTQARRTRGPNRCIALTNQRERIVVGCNEYGQPIGRNKRLLSSYIGIIARDGQKAPLTYSDWRRIPEERTVDMLQAIQTFFDAEIKEMKIKNYYFSLFVSLSVLQWEKDHIEGFAPEVFSWAIGDDDS
ncbi:hypothetical protein MRB53_021419 [Persea americana]|uniref:Uncharacterized protein n=1 Tax=Persea americana TaxID=3435 RepID=A0ACC2L4V6_PERAE|nr:hypothetical protein MRB53_021419 [Persea americana]